jgi:hypothetical protein
VGSKLNMGRQNMDWVSIVREEGRRHSILHADELARRYGLSDVVVRNALRRQEKTYVLLLFFLGRVTPAGKS